MTARNDQPGGPWWRPAATENAGKPDVCASPSTVHYMKASVSCGAQQGAGGVLLGTHYAIHFPGALEDEDDNDGENNNDNSKTYRNGNCGDMSLTMAQPAWEEAMFEKPLTPSDVSKLNRLVIPKLHAERYLPLDMASTARVTLRFEDEEGKEWSFRYSYWTSSQSYVLTKGWSKYVKEKRLEAGDVVSFFRGRTLHIRWRRPVVPSPVSPSSTGNPPQRNDLFETPLHLHSPGRLSLFSFLIVRPLQKNLSNYLF